MNDNSQNMYKYNGIVEQLMCGGRDFVIQLSTQSLIFFFSKPYAWMTNVFVRIERKMLCIPWKMNIWWKNEQWTLCLIRTVNNNINSLRNRECNLNNSMRWNRILVECWFVRLRKVQMSMLPIQYTITFPFWFVERI